MPYTINNKISSIVNTLQRYRFIMLIMFMLGITWSANAQTYYVLYYEEDGVRQYLSINADGTTLEKTPNLSFRCYWKANETLHEAKGSKGVDIFNNQNKEWNSYNESNRKPLTSYVFPNKYLVGESNPDITSAQTGKVQTLSVATSSSLANRWMIDNEYDKTVVFYYWNYKHYVYYSDGWKYSSKGYEQGESNILKIEECTLLSPPAINITESDNVYKVSLTADDGCTIYYTTDGSDPALDSSNITKYTTPFFADKETTVKAIAVKGGNSISIVAHLFLPQTVIVTLDDRENHNWSYYSGVNLGNYNTQYLGKTYSPYPRNVEIIYTANGGSVSKDEAENSFVYYKTLEEGKTSGEYPYTVISNPFSKRPKDKGFGGWMIVNGYRYIKRADGSPATDSVILNLDEAITLVGLPDTAVNCTSAQIKLQATWVDANVTYLDTSTDYTYSNTSGTYETNFLVIRSNYAGIITADDPVTITMVEPDGKGDYRNYYTFTGTIVPATEGNTKIEFAHWNPNAPVDAAGCNFTIGRGMTMDGTARYLYGSSLSTQTVDQIVKVESGRFSQLRHYAESGNYENRVKKQWITLGCDYDRAKNDNTKLTFTSSMYVGHYCTLNLSATDEMCRVYGLSGKFMGNNVGAASYTQCYYMSVSDAYNLGYRYLEIQGGEWLSIAGGTNNYRPRSGETPPYINTEDGLDEKPAFTFRMKGGTVQGSVYGGAEYYDAVGVRTFVITGGTIKGWVAGGANGTRTDGGQLYGTSYIYVGGNARIDSNNSTSVINRAVGGNVFGAGCGYNTSSTSGRVTHGTNVVIADSAYVERGVYGGGSYGFCPEGETSNIYITGGTVAGKPGGVNTYISGYDANNAPVYSAKFDSEIKGGIYGGACQNQGGNVNIYMTGGKVDSGLYGGSNAAGTIAGTVNMRIHGGQVGNITHAANIHGGGYGEESSVEGNITIILDKEDNNTGCVVYGDVYGGGAFGKTQSTTNVTLNAGQVYNSIYGGGLGETAKATGDMNVHINGGIVYSNVFGGGNAAQVEGNTNVHITGGEVTNNVYGGGNMAKVTGKTNVIIGQQ
jgi:hypothetical protein